MDFELLKDVLDEQQPNERKERRKKTKKCKKPCEKTNVKDCDDINGMALGMFGKVDMREMFILWVMFLFLHTELYSVSFLKRFKDATNEDGTMSMKGTLISSVVMIIAVLICGIVF